MTTAERKHHLVYPDLARLKQRLADAYDQRLVLFDISQQQPDPYSIAYRSFCTPSEATDPYAQWIHWQIQDARVYAHCTCTAGYYGTGCKHSALLGDLAGALDEDTEWRILDHEDMESYRTTLDLPAWDKEAGDEQHE